MPPFRTDSPERETALKFDNIQAVICDMDGVLWRGNEPLKGMTEFFQLLDDAALPFVLATNNSSKTPADYLVKLAGMGVNTVEEANIITSGTATVDFLLREYPQGARVHLLGGDGLRQLLSAAGFSLVETGAKVVVVGIDMALTYDKLKNAALNIRAGGRFIATNPDRTFPMPEGLVPGNGSIAALLESATDQRAEFIGKPHPPMFTVALERMNATPANTLMIGDRLNTDIDGAAALGIRTALVLSGVTQMADLATSAVQPDIAYETLLDVVKAWNYTGGKRRR